MSSKSRSREVGGRSRENLAQATLAEIASEAQSVADDLRFLLETAGASALPPLSLDEEGLKLAEKAYRSLEKSFRSTGDISSNQLERLLAIFLGQALIQSKGGEWAFYQGKYHTLNPVVVKLPSGRHLDVFGLSHNLYQNKFVDGASSGQALVRFLEKADMLSVP